MSRWSMLLAALGACLLLVACGDLGGAPADDEYAVYDAVIQELFFRDDVTMVVIGNQTEWWPDPSPLLAQLSEEMPAALPETLDDLRGKVTQQDALEDRFGLGVQVVLVDPSEQRAAGPGTDGWHAKYPGSQGYMTLSRVGLGPKREQALVYVGNMAGPMEGEGICVLLVKREGQWQVQQSALIWLT